MVVAVGLDEAVYPSITSESDALSEDSEDGETVLSTLRNLLDFNPDTSLPPDADASYVAQLMELDWRACINFPKRRLPEPALKALVNGTEMEEECPGIKFPAGVVMGGKVGNGKIHCVTE